MCTAPPQIDTHGAHREVPMKSKLLCSVAALLVAASGALAQNGDLSGQGAAVVTVLPNKSSEQQLNVSQQDIKQIKVGGKDAQVTGWSPLQGANSPVELVFLIDGSARASLGTQMNEISHFVQEMPPNTKMAIAYMENGTAVFASQQPLSSNPSQVLQALHVTSGPIDQSASPYFCLSDLAKHWPSHDRSARRIVVMISDGIDYYDMHYDPEDPYVHAAIGDAVRHNLVVYFLYWADVGRISRMGFEQSAGQNLMLEVTEATGGNSYWEGFGNPVTFQPYFQDLRRRLDNQFGLEFTAPLKGNSPQVENLDFKLSVPAAKVDAPKEVFVHPGGAAAQ